ncbi:MAG TPA: hypothetical protein VG937_22485 [Polyangiaceae bacterium]|nr:hypothetical protein [Polyangiaceae bacterium]
MKTTTLLCGLVTLSLMFTGCKDKEAPKEASEAAPQLSVTAPPPAVTPPQAKAPEAEPVPTEADFEEEAAQQITNKNLEEELDKLERELKSP